MGVDPAGFFQPSGETHLAFTPATLEWGIQVNFVGQALKLGR